MSNGIDFYCNNERERPLFKRNIQRRFAMKGKHSSDATPKPPLRFKFRRSNPPGKTPGPDRCFTKKNLISTLTIRLPSIISPTLSCFSIRIQSFSCLKKSQEPVHQFPFLVPYLCSLMPIYHHINYIKENSLFV
ncbi:hypothetical protein AMTRI_Chr03g142480 [Amborella trichopoda]